MELASLRDRSGGGDSQSNGEVSIFLDQTHGDIVGRKGVFFSFVLFVSFEKQYRAGQASQASLLMTSSVALTLTCFWFSFESVPFHILLCTHVHHWTFSVVQDVCTNFFFGSCPWTSVLSASMVI